MKKALIISSVALVVLVSLFISFIFYTNSHPTRMTSWQLIREAQKKNKFPISNFYMPDTFGVKLEEGEIWHQVLIGSVSTVAEAESKVESFVNLQYSNLDSIVYIGENDYYYQFRLKQTSINFPDFMYTYRVIVYKANAVFCSFSSQSGYSFAIQKLDKKSVRNLMDLRIFDLHFSWHTSRVICRELVENKSDYLFTYYSTSITGGDWGLHDTAVLRKSKYKVNKNTGEIQEMTRFPSDIMKEATIPGTRN